MKKILFICHGNICRSTMAEFVMRDLVDKAGLEHEFYIESAATSREEIGNDTDPRTKRKLTEKGVPFTKRKARQMTKADYNEFDYIIAMDDNNIRNMMRIIGSDAEDKVSKLLEFAGRNDGIADPWYTGNFDETWDDVLEGCTALLDKLSKNK